MDTGGTERWETAEAIAAARARYAGSIRDYASPIAYGVARIDGSTLEFGHVNDVGGTHQLPAVILAFVCGHRHGTATYRLAMPQMQRAVELLAPAEACPLYDHPNLWSWRSLLESAPAHAEFVAVFVADLADRPVDAYDRVFRSLLADP